MSKNVDERVVSMQFDNANFERNVQTSLGTLEKLKQSLGFKGASKGLEEIDSAVKKVNFSPLASGIDSVQAKISALQVIGVTALANITNSAINAGKRITSALTIDPVKSGFQEYETQINAVQTILANTESKGTTLEQVNNALDELNKYADQTIYNFTEMTRNIGTFTAAGVDLEKSVTSIKGIANLAAASGSTSLQASTAMYQLSQALAAGRVSLMDWNSVVNAGMGGELFQNALKRTAEHFGTDVDAMIEKYGSFRESLTQGGWLTADVLTETLTQLSGAYSEADLIAQGYSEKQAKEIADLAQTALDAATKVKTFTQLFDTLKEALQSGWTQSWEIIVGDFEEAKDLYTQISDALGGMINTSAEARNQVLSEGLSSGWKQFLSQGISDEESFKETVVSVAKEHGVAIEQMIEDSGSFEKSLKNGWLNSDILAESIDKLTTKTSGLSDKQLEQAGYTKEQVKDLQQLNESIKNGSINLDEFVEKMSRPSGRENIITGMTNVLTYLADAIKPVREAFSDIFPAMTGSQLYEYTEKFKELTSNLKISDETADKLKRTFSGVFSIFDMGKQAIGAVLKPFGEFLTGGDAGSIADTLLTVTASIGDFFTKLNEGIKAGEGFSVISDTISRALGLVSGAFETISGGAEGFMGVLTNIGDVVSDIFGKVIEVVGGAVNWIRDNISAGDIFAGLAGGGIFVLAKKIGNVFDKVKDFFDSFGEGDDKVSKIADILDSVHSSLESFQNGIKVASLVGIAGAVAILTSSLETISQIKPVEVAYSLTAIGTMIAVLNGGFKGLVRTLSKFDGTGTIKASISMMAIAEAVNILASAMEKMSELSFGEIVKGLAGIAGSVTALSLSIKAIGKGGVTLRTSVAILAIAEACTILADALTVFGNLTWDEIGRGLTSMGGALAEFVVTLSVLSKVGGFGSVLGGTGLLIAVQSLDEISAALENLGALSWDEIQNGLAAMGGALGEFVITLGVLGKLGGIGSILGGTSILIAAQALDEISETLSSLGNLSWDEIGRGLGAMGGALAELAIISGSLGKLSGLSGLLGAGTILLGVQGLSDLSDALQDFGTMSWDEIGRGLGAMGGALTELAVISGLLGKLAPIGGLLGSGSLLLGIQGLGDLADALQKFGTMSWDEIGRGLAAMGGALGETALGGLLNTLSGLGAMSISTIAQPLGDLADSVKKWENVNIPLGLGVQLGLLAGGIMQFTLTGFGASSIATVAAPLGTMADSVAKWQNISIPENLGSQIGSLASGVMKFTFGGFGADALSTAAPGIGVMADSIKKWSGVVIPEGLETGLKGIASGVQAFTFAFAGGWSIGAINEPLSGLADSVRKWSGVIIPENIGTGLKSLADGVKAFTFAFAGGWSIGAINEPLSGLAETVKKWNGVSIPENIQNGLSGLADGVKSFTFAFAGGWSLEAINEPLAGLADAVKKWNGVSVPEGIETTLQSLANGLKSMSGINLGSLGNDSLGKAVSSISKLISALEKMNDIDTSVGTVLNSVLSSIGNSASSFHNAAKNLVERFESGMKVNSVTVSRNLIQPVSSAMSTIRGYYGSFYSTGSYLVSGFVAGIRNNIASAAAAAAAMAAAASSAARANLNVHSPSKVFEQIGKFVPEGFANGIYKAGYFVADSIESMSNIAIDGTQNALFRVAEIMDSDMDMQPTIRPVVDLSSVESSADRIGSLFGITPSLSVLNNVNGINSAMKNNQTNQNGELISAINKLRKDIGTMSTSTNTYNINGITYDDGSNVSDAIQTLIRAAIIERRT